jgi:hypothetical protein
MFNIVFLLTRLLHDLSNSTIEKAETANAQIPTGTSQLTNTQSRAIDSNEANKENNASTVNPSTVDRWSPRQLPVAAVVFVVGIASARPNFRKLVLVAEGSFFADLV